MTGEKIILTDEPLKSPNQDRLGFAPFAEKIATIIKNMQVKESVVFAVYGKWGSGKTTFLNFLVHYLKEEDSIIIVKFNPWWFSGKENLLLQFFNTLNVVLGKDGTKLEKVTKYLKIFSKILGLLSSSAPIISPFLKPAKDITDELNNLLTEINNKTVAEIKEEICNELEKFECKIVVLIDDIDRLTANEIRELFTIVKAVADFPNTVYILAFDKEVVIRALEKVQEGKGEDYLEKIIQVPIELPLANKTTIRKMLIDELNAVLSGTPEELFDQTYWGNVYFDGIDPFIKTVRDVKRLTNAIRVTYPSVKGEVNAVDFTAIETLRVFCPKVYEVIKNNPNMFCGNSQDLLYGSQNPELKQFHQNWLSDLDNIPDNLKEAIKNLLKRLFPKLECVFGNTHYGHDWEQEWRRECRICSREIFSRFFCYSVPSDDLSRAEMEIILNSLPDKGRFCEYLKYLIKQKRSDGSTKHSVFLERMEDYTSKIPQDYIPIIIETFFDIGDEFIIPEDEGKGFLSWRNDIRMGRIIWQLLRRYNDKNKRFEILKNAFENGKAISMMVKELISFWKQHGKYGGTKKSDKDILLDENHLETLQEIVLDKIKEAVKEGKLLNTPFLSSILYRWKEWGNEGEVRDWVSKAVASDEKLPIFLSKFLQKTSSATITDRVAKIRWRLNPNWLKDFIDVDILEKRCNEVLSNESVVATLDDKQKLAIRQFLEEKHLLDKGKNPDDPLFYRGVGER